MLLNFRVVPWHAFRRFSHRNTRILFCRSFIMAVPSHAPNEILSSGILGVSENGSVEA